MNEAIANTVAPDSIVSDYARARDAINAAAISYLVGYVSGGGTIEGVKKRLATLCDERARLARKQSLTITSLDWLSDAKLLRGNDHENA